VIFDVAPRDELKRSFGDEASLEAALAGAVPGGPLDAGDDSDADGRRGPSTRNDPHRSDSRLGLRVLTAVRFERSFAAHADRGHRDVDAIELGAWNVGRNEKRHTRRRDTARNDDWDAECAHECKYGEPAHRRQSYGSSPRPRGSQRKIERYIRGSRRA
jgi:hypothetical protein